MKFPTVGQRAWIYALQGAEVKAGWPHFLPVTVQSIRREGLCLVTVRDGRGRTVELPNFELDCGQEFEVETGQWIPESDPRAIAHLREILARPLSYAGNVDDGREGVRFILGRNGKKA
jgi:hypothetical protein